MRFEQISVVVAVALASALFASPASTQSTGLDDMVGARAGQAEGELARRGYRNVRGEKGDDRSYTYWWNADRRQCVTIATMNGRYDSITPTPAPDCRQPANAGRPRDREDRSDRWDRRPPRADDRRVDMFELSRYCKGEASAAFNRRPSEVTTVGAIKQRNGYTVRGWYDGNGKRSTFFTCTFDEDGRFLSVI